MRGGRESKSGRVAAAPPVVVVVTGEQEHSSHRVNGSLVSASTRITLAYTHVLRVRPGASASPPAPTSAAKPPSHTCSATPLRGVCGRDTYHHTSRDEPCRRYGSRVPVGGDRIVSRTPSPPHNHKRVD